jgi:transposase
MGIRSRKLARVFGTTICSLEFFFSNYIFILLSKSEHKESDEYHHFWNYYVWETSVISIRRSINLKQSVLMVEEGRPISEFSRELGTAQSLLPVGKRNLMEGKIDSFPGKGLFCPEDEELRYLIRENKRLRMERDILKKAVAIFSEEPQ